MTEEAVKTFQDRFKRVIGSLDAESKVDATNALYAEWAQTYDQELAAINFAGPEIVARYFDEYAQKLGLPKDAEILDVAAGTGLVGIELKKRGYSNVDGSEPCREILAVAERRGVYRRYLVAATGAGHRMDLPDACYDAILVSGALPHCMEDGLEEMVRLTRPGGLFACVGRETYLTDDATWIPAALDRLQAEGKLEKLEFGVLEEKFYMQTKALIIVCKIL